MLTYQSQAGPASPRLVAAFILSLDFFFLVSSAPMNGIHLVCTAGMAVMLLAILGIPRRLDRYLWLLISLTVLFSLAGIVQHTQAGLNVCWPLVMCATGLIGLVCLRTRWIPGICRRAK